MSRLIEALIARAPERLNDLVLPGPRDERWRYSTLRTIESRAFRSTFGPSRPLDAPILSHIEAASPRLVFVDGRFDPALSSPASISDAVTWDASAPPSDPPSDWPFARAAAAAPAFVLRVLGKVPNPIHLFTIVTTAAQDAVVQHALRIESNQDSAASIVHHRFGPADGTAFLNLWRDLELADRAVLNWLETAQEGERTSVVVGTRASIGAAARFALAEVAAGASLYRHDLAVTLNAEYSEFVVRGCTMVTKRRHADLHIDARHRARHTRSDILWRGLADQRGHGVFAGRLIVESGADGADALLSNKNLLLSSHAEIDTRPVLEIYADEVKAAHGATVGRLDDHALFYLRSRGIGDAEARRILVRAFAREPLLQLRDPRLGELAMRALSAILPEDTP